MFRRLVRLGLAIVLALGSSSLAQAVNGRWIRDDSTIGFWSDIGNWAGGVVANGIGGIADFSTLNITAGSPVILDSARTIGSLLFGDTIPSHDWSLYDNGIAANTLTMAVSAGAPAITVNNQTAAISLGLFGTGIVKSGSGTLQLSGNVDNVGTGMNVTAGTVILNKSSSSSVHAIGGGGLTITGGVVQLGGTGGDQIYDFANVAVNSGTFDVRGLSETFNVLNLQGAGTGGSGALERVSF